MDIRLCSITHILDQDFNFSISHTHAKQKVDYIQEFINSIASYIQ